MSRPAARPRRRGSGHAAKPRKPVRARLALRLPSRTRIGAFLVFATLVGGLVTLVNGPWLRVARTVHAGVRYTPAEQLDAALSAYVGQPLLALDRAILEAQLRSLPTVAEARVGGHLPNALAVTIVEKRPAATWLTPVARLVLAPDGTVIASLPRTGELARELADLPAVEDRRSGSRALGVGAALPVAELSAAERLLSLDPELLGSRASGFAVRIDDEYGFVLASAQPPWEAALGFYQAAPGETQEEAMARLEAQITAVRTLFSERSERSVRWVDARNPGKVYWTP